MATTKLIYQIEELFEEGDISINGSNPWDIVVKNELFYDFVIKNGSLGLGDSYVNGYWDCADLEGFFYRLLKHKIPEKSKKIIKMGNLLELINIKLFSKRDPYKVGKQHYDLGNELYQKMLGSTMAYSCAYWKDSETLDEAQIAKFEIICKKLDLQKGETVLDIGCGWGGLMEYMCKNYQVNCVGLTVSREQKKFIEDKFSNLDIKVYQMDYIEFSENNDQIFDKVVSVGMMEHVGLNDYNKYFNIVSKIMNEKSLFLLHTIGDSTSNNRGEDWINKYIFPESKLPSLAQLSKASELEFVTEDVHNFGVYYRETLLAWYQNFCNSWSDFEEKYGERFYRMWRYYLLSCAGGFKSRHIQLWQIVYSKNLECVYNSLR
jgi:cyclopropane-fatty-acyl-phospholipid synthase